MMLPPLPTTLAALLFASQVLLAQSKDKVAEKATVAIRAFQAKPK
jgi:hypothetical protein